MKPETEAETEALTIQADARPRPRPSELETETRPRLPTPKRECETEPRHYHCAFGLDRDRGVKTEATSHIPRTDVVLKRSGESLELTEAEPRSGIFKHNFIYVNS